MPVFFKGDKRVLFIHVPKAGGTSIEVFFEANGFKTFYLDRGGSPDSLNPVRACSPQHMAGDLLRAMFDIAKFDFVFMTVRHPVRRFLSKFVMETGERSNVERLETWIAEDFCRVLRNPRHMDNHLRPQVDFRVDEARVFRLEDSFGGALIASLRRAIGDLFPAPTLGHEMRAGGGAPDFTKVHPGLRAVVLTYYAEDFATFGYESPTLAG
jgi:hypothetical protein